MAVVDPGCASTVTTAATRELRSIRRRGERRPPFVPATCHGRGAQRDFSRATTPSSRQVTARRKADARAPVSAIARSESMTSQVMEAIARLR
jgi:hypothetical protein